MDRAGTRYNRWALVSVLIYSLATRQIMDKQNTYDDKVKKKKIQKMFLFSTEGLTIRILKYVNEAIELINSQKAFDEEGQEGQTFNTY